MLKIITLKIFYLNNLKFFVTLTIYVLDILIYFKDFLDCLQLELFNAKGINAKNIYLNYICAGISNF